jgi:hypothetical protein
MSIPPDNAVPLLLSLIIAGLQLKDPRAEKRGVNDGRRLFPEVLVVKRILRQPAAFSILDLARMMTTWTV